jgi:hypothetical protein
MAADKGGLVSGKTGRKSAAASTEQMYPEMQRRRRVADDEPEEEEGVKGGMFRGMILPCTLIVIGLVIMATQIQWTAPQLPSTVDLSVGQVMVLLMLTVVTIYAGAAASVVVLRVNLGQYGPTALKLASIAVFALALATPVARLDRGSWSITGMVMGFHILILTYWVLLSVYYRMDIHEVLLSVAIITLLQTLAFAAVLA